MLNCCYGVSVESLLEFNCSKCVCVAIGPSSKYNIANLTLGQHSINWSSEFKYLGVSFCTGTRLVVDINLIKRKFFASCNCILGTAKCLNDIITLNLMESHCLPILLYATTAMNLTNEQLHEINAGWNSVYRRVFGFNRWESVKAFIAGIGRLDFISLRTFLCLKFYKFGLVSTNEIFRNIVTLHLFSINFKRLIDTLGWKHFSIRELRHLSVGALKRLVTNAFVNNIVHWCVY